MTLCAFDGTWAKDEDVSSDDSNVVKFRDASDGLWYSFSGVGTSGKFVVGD